MTYASSWPDSVLFSGSEDMGAKSTLALAKTLSWQAPGFLAVLQGPHHIYAFINESYQSLIGFRDLVGRPLREALPESLDQGLINLLDGVYASGEPHKAQGFPLTLKTAHEGCVRISYLDFILQPIKSRDGSVTGIFVQGNDATERKMANDILRESEERYRALIEASAAIVWRAGPDGNIIDAWGWGEHVGQHQTDYTAQGWMEAVHPDDRAGVFARWRRSFASGKIETAEYRIRRASGEYTWMLAKAIPLLRPDGTVREWVGTLTDIHDRKVADERIRASEERYRALVTATASIIWQADARGSVTDFSGYTEYEGKLEDLYGSGWLALVHPDDRNRLIAEWHAIVASEQPGESEFRFCRKAGVYRWVCCRAAPLKDENGAIREWVGTLNDEHNKKEAEAALILRDRSLEAIAQGILISDARLPSNPIIYSNAAFEQLTGYRREEVVGREGHFLSGPDVDPEETARVRAKLQAGQTIRETIVNYRKDGTEFINDLTVAPVRDINGDITHYVATQSDITDRERLEERLQLALTAGRMVAWEEDLETGYVTRSENAMELLGIGSGPASEFMDRIVPEDRAARERFSHRTDLHESGTIEFRYLLPSGKIMWFAGRAQKAGPNRVVGVSFDITERKAAEDDIWQAANHDALTGLPNRSLFQRRLEHELATAKLNDTPIAVLLIDFDHFKEINDALGHDAGDAFLQETATRLKVLTSDRCTVSRFSGDEFAVLMSGSPLAEASKVAQVILEKLSEPFAYLGQSLVSRASIGVAAFPDHDANPADLLKDADIALFEAKAQGRYRATIYRPALRAAVDRRVAVLAEVHESLLKGEIVPFYQPKISLRTGRVIGLEVLARWKHPTKGILSPEYFGDAFDEPRLAIMLSDHLLTKSVSDLRGWLDAGLRPGVMAFNLSSCEFSQPSLADHVLAVLDATNIPSKNFEIEVTETVLLSRNPKSILATLTRFHDKGVSIALDDFGTGYGSLTHLKQFPVTHIKIDRSFVSDLEHDTGDEAIVAAIINLGRGFGLTITAEGVETVGQARRLTELGCHHGQGYLYAKATEAAGVPMLLARSFYRHPTPRAD